MAGPSGASAGDKGSRRTSAGQSLSSGSSGSPFATSGNAMGPQDMEAAAAKLSDPSIDAAVKLATANNLKDHIETHRDLDHNQLFNVLLPCFMDILQKGTPSMLASSNDHRLRHALFQILHRLPHVDALRAHSSALMTLLLQLLRVENEENAVIALKIIIDLHRSFSKPAAPQPSASVPPPDPSGSQPPASVPPETQGFEAAATEFLEILVDIFKAMPAVIEEVFASSSSTGTTPAEGHGAGSPANPLDEAPPGLNPTPITTGPLPLGMKSIKVLQECPAAIVFIYQTYKDIVPASLDTFIPLVFDFMSLQAQPQAKTHQQAKEQGRTFIGVSPDIPKDKRPLFGEFVLAQIKAMSFLAYTVRIALDRLMNYVQTIPEVAVRLLKDCPPEASNSRKELLVATRHILQTELRMAFVGQIDTLLDDTVLVGTGITSHETLRPLAYSVLADLIHHIRTELSLAQLSRVVHLYSANIHDPTLGTSIQTMCTKLLLNLIEPISQKEGPEGNAVLSRALTAFVSKMEGLAEIRDDLLVWAKGKEPPRPSAKGKEKEKGTPDPKGKEKEKGTPDPKGKRKSTEEPDAMEVDVVETTTAAPVELDETDIEKSKIIGRSVIMTDQSTDIIKDARFLFRNVLLCVKAITTVYNRWPDPEMLGRFFEATVKCFVMYEPMRDRDAGREQKEVMDAFGSIVIGAELLTFQEVIETRMDFFLDELVRNNELLAIPQTLLSNETVSQPFVAIVFRFLSSKLPELGQDNKERTTVMLRLFKMSFMAVTIFPEKNETVLLPHLSHLIMDSLKLASTAIDPNSYYLLLRALFRSIGGGRFEVLYKEVLPLLQVLLERLNALLKAADRSKRDIFVELCLTVPVRLSVLLPYLSYLMRPLVFALQAGPDLVSQGLRTLELCVDNLTQEFLNPIMAPVIDEVMAALWKLLKPLPSNHTHAHITLRILGKIGGRNRKNYNMPALDWKPLTEEAVFDFKFGMKEAKVKLGPVVDVALKTIRRNDAHYRRNSYAFLKYAAAIFIRDKLPPGEVEDTFGNVLRGLFDATRIEEFQEEATEYVLKLAELIFSRELRRKLPDGQVGKHALPLCSALLDAVIENLSGAEGSDLERASEQTQKIVELMLAAPKNEDSPADASRVLLSQVTLRLSSMCYDQSWLKKTGAAAGISVLVRRLNLDVSRILDHEVEIIRGLLFALKDMPSDPPTNVKLIGETMLHILKVCNAPGAHEDTAAEKNKVTYLTGLLLIELCSQIGSVRDIVKEALKILSDSLGVSLTEMLMPVRERLMTPIFTKPLRALAFAMQIGHIDAVTYCMTLDPPLIEPSEALSRLLHEALGIADADDSALIGQKATAKTMAPLTQLRVVCVQLLSAAMASPVFLSTPQQQPTRMKALSVYFKLLYSSSPEVVDAAYQSLKSVMASQGKLPKDLLQNGLKPVLMNLSDHKKLSVASLAGLARLLELLTNYFKVEIGQKLLDHFRNLAVPSEVSRAAMRASSRQPSEEAPLDVMAAIVNVFHLLPHPAALCFLEDIVRQVVSVEKIIKVIKVSCFTTPLAKYLNLSPIETTQFFFTHLTEEHFTATFRAVIASEHAGAIRDHITASAQSEESIFVPCFNSSGDLAYYAAVIIRELLEVEPDWLVRCPSIPLLLIERWVSDIRRQRLASQGEPHFQQLAEDTIVLEICMRYLEHGEHIDTLFHIVDSFTYSNSADRSALRRFLNERIAMSTNVPFKRSLLDRWLDIYENAQVTQAHKTAILRFIVNPILLVSFSRGEAEAGLVDAEYLDKVHSKIWLPALEREAPERSSIAEDSLRIELVYKSTLLLKSCSTLIAENRKDVIKFGWVNIIKVEDILVRHSAYVLVARFLEQYEAPSKIVLQIYTALLRAHQPEARGLVREALDILAPVLPKRAQAGNQPEQGPPLWAKWTRKILLEESNSIQQLVNVYQLLVRHPDLFFPARDTFVPHMVSSLGKLTQTPTVTTDTRLLTLDLMELMLKWERKRLESTKTDEAKMDVDEPEAAEKEKVEKSPKRARPARAVSVAASTASAGHGTGYMVPHQLREQVINTLLRLIAAPSETGPRNPLLPRALLLLREFLSPAIWSDVNVKLSFFQRAFAQADPNEQQHYLLCNSAEVLNVVISFKPDEWMLNNIGTHHKIVENGYATPDSRLHAAQRPLLERLFEVIASKLPLPPADAPEDRADIRSFVDWATTTISDSLSKMTNLAGALGILTAWAKSSPAQIDQFFPPIVRVLTRLVKEHVTAQAPVPTNDPQIRLLVNCLEILRQRVSHLGEHRRWFLSAMVQLVEKSSNIDLCRFLLNMMRKSVTDKTEQFPTLREKAGILAKMQSFESRNNESLMREFLTLVLDIYSDPVFARSELTVRLENSFLLGCRNRDPNIRSKFLELFDKSLSTNLYTRLHFILGVQSWEGLADSYWIHQGLDLVLGCVDRQEKLMETQPEEAVTDSLKPFVDQLQAYTTGSIVDVTRRLLYADPGATHTIWVSTFRGVWDCFTRREQQEINRYLINLLTKDYHLRNIDRRPNVVSTLLTGALACSPALAMPPHVVRYLSKTYNAWHVGLELLQDALEDPKEEETVRESTLDALSELYSELSEDDLFYGLWRRRAGYSETNAAISWEQIGQWQQAQLLYDSAQLKARTGVMPFSESEMALWEDHWIMTAQKLQQWDILAELARNEGNKDMLLECAWRLSDWGLERETVENAIEQMSPVPTPRRRIFEAFMTLLKGGQPGQSPEDRKRLFHNLCDEGMQLSLRKWFYLPEVVSQAHVPLLHVFQQFVELQEAQQIFTSLATTNAQNLDQRSQELKNVLQTWRERLPNLWDDINIWSDLVAWRQHVFNAINKAYLPLVPQQNGGANQSANSSFAYRGFHETAWIINRFAHVARKHHLNDVCIASLTKIYTLPNIEIQEAFLKLREQAKCHFQHQNELAAGLEVINNTNLMYFGPSQKAEFFTLKGMFLAKLNVTEEANAVFNQGVSMDMTFAKAWAKWGEYNDKIFKDSPDLVVAADAVSCYLQAAGLYKSHKSRKLLVRILWLLSLDDSNGTVAKAFDAYKGEVPVWYWITFIPQLLLSLSQREARYARILLMHIAKSFPQALFFPLRTTREDLTPARRQHQAAEERRLQAANANAANAMVVEPTSDAAPAPAAPGTPAPDAAMGTPAPAPAPAAVAPGPDGTAVNLAASTSGGTPQPQQPTPAPPPPQQQQNTIRFPWEHVEEIMSILKTAFPLLALSMEMIVDQISTRFKPQPDEDIYRLVSALLNDALPQYVARASQKDDDGLLPQATVSNVTRFAESLHPAPLQKNFEADFVSSKPTLREFVERLQRWRDKYETLLKKKAKVCSLESASHWLVEFQYQKFDEIEVPGQYLQHDDNNLHFIKVDHFANKYEVTRSHGVFFRRLTMIGTDGTTHSFATQLPSTRSSRREEKIMQLFRMMNCPLATRKEARRRNLSFKIPIVVPLAPGVRLLENDASIISMQDIYEQHCDAVGMSKDAPIFAHTERIRAIARLEPPMARNEFINARLELAEEIATKMIPDDILKRFMTRSMVNPIDLWHSRREMTLSMAAFIFMTYVMSMGARLPNRIHLSRATGKLYTSEIIPSISSHKPEFSNPEAVPFRFTPNFQRFLGAIGTEGLLTSSLMAIARSLTEIELEFENRLSIFVREEMLNWSSLSKTDRPLRELIMSNVEAVTRRAKLLSCSMEREKPPSATVPVNQSLLELLSQATNVQRLSSQDAVWVAAL